MSADVGLGIRRQEPQGIDLTPLQKPAGFLRKMPVNKI